MIKATAQFAGALGWITSRSQLLHLADVDDVAPEAAKQLGIAQALLGPISLLFGPSSTTAEGAKTAHWHVTNLVVPIRQLSELATLDERRASPANQKIKGSGNQRGALGEAQDGLAAFTAAAGEALGR